MKRMHRVWQSNVSRNIKVRLFQATVETVLLYGAETWTMTKWLESSEWHLHPTTKVCPWDQMARSPDQRSSVPKHQPVSERLRARRLKGRHGMGAKQTYPDIILRDCGMQREDKHKLWKAMHDKNC